MKNLNSISKSCPAQWHAGADHAILQQRYALYCLARERNTRRWSGKTRNWTPIGAVTLNPERDAIVNAYSNGFDKQSMAA